MSLQQDIIFVKALKSNTSLMKKLPAGDIYNTSIALPEAELDNVDIPYIIVSFDGLQNDTSTKDCSYEGESDRVQIGIEVAARSRRELAELTIDIRKTIREYFESIDDSDEDYFLVPIDYEFSAQGVNYDADKPCYWQVLNYQCDTNIEDYEQDQGAEL